MHHWFRTTMLTGAIALATSFAAEAAKTDITIGMQLEPSSLLTASRSSNLNAALLVRMMPNAEA